MALHSNMPFEEKVERALLCTFQGFRFSTPLPRVTYLIYSFINDKQYKRFIK